MEILKYQDFKIAHITLYGYLLYTGNAQKHVCFNDKYKYLKLKFEFIKYKNTPELSKGINYKNKIFYKIINRDMKNRNFTFVLGQNILDEEYKPVFITHDDCSAGGFYFCEMKDFKNWSQYYSLGNIYEVILPDDALVEEFKNKYKANTIIIQNPLSITEFIKKHNMS